MRDLIVFAEDYCGLPSSTQHLINGIAKNRKVMWVNSIGLRQPTLSLKDSKRVLNKVLSWNSTNSSSTSYKNDQLHLVEQVNVITVPAPSSYFARIIAREVMLKQLKPLIKKMGLIRPILWTSLPTASDLCGHLDESATIYYCGDDFSALAGVDHDTVMAHEARLINKADLILTASEALYNKFPEDKTHHLTHGVDLNMFTKPVPPAKEIRQLHNNGNRPIAGFYGSLSNWLDYSLLGKVCSAMPNWDFVFIGPIELNQNLLPKLNNVYYLGKRRHDELARYSQHWDVSILPFRDNEQIRACNPLKLLEYMAVGKPIVSCPFPALEPYKNFIHCAEGSEEFIEALLQARSGSAIPESLVEDKSWSRQSERLCRLMEQL